MVEAGLSPASTIHQPKWIEKGSNFSITIAERLVDEKDREDLEGKNKQAP